MNETFNIIRDNLTRSYIFYIPEHLYNEVQNSQLKDLIPHNDINTVAFLDRHRELTKKEHLFNKVEIFTKSSLLEENTFLLLDEQAKSDLEQFGVLLQKYREHLDIHTHITSWMSDNLNTCINGASESLQNMFSIQSNSFKQHQDFINTTFGSVEIDLKGIQINNYFKEKFASPNFKTTVPDFFEVKDKFEKTTSKTKKRKKVLITNEEADAFLLESVFNIKVTNPSFDSKSIDKSTKK